MGVKINVEGFKTKTLFNTASELFINKVRRCGEDYDHRGACSNTELYEISQERQRKKLRFLLKKFQRKEVSNEGICIRCNAKRKIHLHFKVQILCALPDRL